MQIFWTPFPSSRAEDNYRQEIDFERLASYTSIALTLIVAVVAALAANGIISTSAATTTIYVLGGLNLTLVAGRILTSLNHKKSLELLSIFALCTIATLVIGGLGSANILSASTMGWAIFGCSLGALTFGKLNCGVSASNKDLHFQYIMEHKPRYLRH